MSRVVHILLQAAALLVQYGAEVTSLVPAKYKTWVHLAIGLAQAVMVWKSQEFNTDGTPQKTAFLKALVLCLLLVPIARAQVTASFSLQPTRASKAAFGSLVTTYSVDICNKGAAPVDIPAGLVNQAAATKFAPVNPALADAILGHARTQNKWIKVSRIVEVLAGIAGVFGAGQVIHMGTSALTAVVSVPPIAHELQGYFAGQEPPAAGTYSSQFVAGTIHLDAGRCDSRLMLGQYVKGLSTFATEVK